ncbi:hypothetical protein BOTBODRAFT_494879 [Botryobasidium botryosum FD-172 SS1]|uniref:Uncharacterized protein n=1 Tax=Botryobasidium botryosum (strain FD-172 SS1) TaxID=930990 RepID=A0A067M4B9_BOTB1|nr:hypothetical protein BOTBODRAFT_494879 [Botryobasidium botryosum FD-172 SS1]
MSCHVVSVSSPPSSAMKAPSLFARLKSPRTPATPDDARDQPRPQTAPNPRTPPTLDTTVISTPKLVLTSDTADSPTTFHFSTPDSLHRPSSAILPSPPRKSADYERGRERPAPSRHSIHEIVSSDGTRTSFQLTESPIALTTPTGPTREHYFAENSPPLSPPAHVQLTSQSRTSTATPPPMLRNNTLRPARPVSPVYTPEPVYAMRNSSASIRSSSATRGAAAVHDRPDSSSGLPTTGRHSHYSAMITRIPSNQSLYERSVASAAAAALVPATPPPRRRDSIASARSDLSSSFPQSQSQPHSLPDKDANTQHTPPPPLVRSPPIDARDFHPRNTSTPVRSASISVVSPSPAPGASAASKRAGGKGHAKALSHDTGDLLFASGSLHALSANNTINGSNAPNGMTGTNGLNGSNGNSNGGSLNATTKTRWKRGNSVSQQQQQPPPGLAGGIASAMVAAGMIMPQVQPHIHAHMPLSPKETPSQNQVAGQPGKEKKEKEKKEKGRVRGSSAASQRQNSNETNGYEGGGQRRSMDGRPPSVFTSASARSRSARASVSISSPRAPRSELFPHDGASSVNANVNDEHEDDGYRDRNGDNEDNEDDNEDSDEDEDEGDGDGDGDGGMSPYGLSFDQIDIPVTGFAVASSKRNADFHELFPSVAEGDYLIEGKHTRPFPTSSIPRISSLLALAVGRTGNFNFIFGYNSETLSGGRAGGRASGANIDAVSDSDTDGKC